MPAPVGPRVQGHVPEEDWEVIQQLVEKDDQPRGAEARAVRQLISLGAQVIRGGHARRDGR